MTGTINIPIKTLLLHISNVINACDLSSVTPSRVKQYLKYRFKNALPSEDDLDTILKNVIKSAKLSQVLNGGSVHFREVNYDSLDTYEAKLKDTTVEYETEDYVLTKEELPKERVINSNMKRVDPCHYALQNLFPKTPRSIRGFVKQKRKQTGFVQRKRMFYKSLTEIVKRRVLDRRKYLAQKKRKRLAENLELSRVLQNKTKHPKKEPSRVLQKNTKRPKKEPSRVLQKNTKRPKKKQTGFVQRKRTTVPRQKTKCSIKNGPHENVLELSPAEKTLHLLNEPSTDLQENTKRPKKEPSRVLQKNTKRPKKEPSRVLQKNTKHPEKTKKKPLYEETMYDNSVWYSQVTGVLKLCVKRSLPMEPYHGEVKKSKTVPKKKQETNTKEPYHGEVKKSKTVPKKKQETNTKSLTEKKVPRTRNAPAKESERLFRHNVLSYLQENFSTLSNEQLKAILRNTTDEAAAIMKCSELCN
ncbi:transcriptional regulator ATRX homolog isoform X9 [Parasteatoda tepidariorum]|uniref:transcriptional regulator ATRX homolog isoform X9 n=1 Tax=Parasteatoda tepidariorum TaxID=114398 RepID=UPI0039BCA1BB